MIRLGSGTAFARSTWSAAVNRPRNCCGWAATAVGCTNEESLAGRGPALTGGDGVPLRP